MVYFDCNKFESSRFPQWCVSGRVSEHGVKDNFKESYLATLLAVSGCGWVPRTRQQLFSAPRAFTTSSDAESAGKCSVIGVTGGVRMRIYKGRRAHLSTLVLSCYLPRPLLTLGTRTQVSTTKGTGGDIIILGNQSQNVCRRVPVPDSTDPRRHAQRRPRMCPRDSSTRLWRRYYASATRRLLPSALSRAR